MTCRPPSAVSSARATTSDSYENLARVVRQIQDEMAKNPGIQGVDVDLRLNKPELRIQVDRDKAADMGVSVEVTQNLGGGHLREAQRNYA